MPNGNYIDRLPIQLTLSSMLAILAIQRSSIKMSIVGPTVKPILVTACTGHHIASDTRRHECREMYLSSQDHSGLGL